MKRLQIPPGQSLVELAVILPLLLIMLMGMADYALLYTLQTRLRNAVAEGGYVAAQNPGNEAIVRSQVRTVLQELNPPITDADITITPCVEVRSDEYETEIRVQYTRSLLFGLFGSGLAVDLEQSTTVPQFGSCE
jgi:Flp pilus assembly protein TadG